MIKTIYQTNNIVEKIERGLKKGYWDKSLIPQLETMINKLELYEQFIGEDMLNKHMKSSLIILSKIKEES